MLKLSTNIYKENCHLHRGYTPRFKIMPKQLSRPSLAVLNLTSSSKKWRMTDALTL